MNSKSTPNTNRWLGVLVFAAVVTILAILQLQHSRQPFLPVFLDAALRRCTSEIESLAKLYMLIPINEHGAGSDLCKTVLSSVVHGYTPILINWESQTTSRPLLQLEKVSAVHGFLHGDDPSLDPGDLVLMIDAFDVWLQLPKEHLIARFMEIEGGQKVVTGADKLCWPNVENGDICRNVPESPLPAGSFGTHPTKEEYSPDGYRFHNRPRFSNSGTVMGNVTAMREVYGILLDHMEQQSHADNPTDQGIFNELLEKRKITVHYWYRLFYPDSVDTDNMQVMGVPDVALLTASPHNRDDPPCAVLNSPRNPPFELLPPLFTHRITGQVPAAVHLADGWHKPDIQSQWGRTWFSKPDKRFHDIVLDRLRNGTVHFAHNRTDVRYFDLCPMSVLDIPHPDKVEWKPTPEGVGY